MSHAGAPCGGAGLTAHRVRGSAGLQAFPLHVARSSTQQVNIEVHGPELVRFDDTIAAIADAVGCGNSCCAGYRAVRDTVQYAGYRAVRDTVSCGIPCRAGYRAWSAHVVRCMLHRYAARCMLD